MLRLDFKITVPIRGRLSMAKQAKITMENGAEVLIDLFENDAPKADAQLVSEVVIDMLLLKFDKQIAIEENEEVKRGLEKAKALTIEFSKSDGG